MIETDYSLSLVNLAAAGIIAWHIAQYRPGELFVTRCVWIFLGLFSSIGGLLLYFGFFDVIMDFIRREVKAPMLEMFRREVHRAVAKELRHEKGSE